MDWKYDKEKGELYLCIKILELEIPKEIKDQKEQILKDIKEAFEEAFGNPYSGLHKEPNQICKIDLEYEGEII